jgi:hypothetical protein
MELAKAVQPKRHGMINCMKKQQNYNINRVECVMGDMHLPKQKNIVDLQCYVIVEKYSEYYFNCK